jgi:beta-glucosidase
MVNAAGLDFYDRLVDGLLAANIQPFATLYHWDLPQALQEKGGWGNRAIVEQFACYTEVVAQRLGDRVKHWITLNEPHVFAYVGHADGRHAPGLRSLSLAYPASDMPADRMAARISDGRLNQWFLDPLFGRGYPQDIMTFYGDAAPQIDPGDMEAIASPLDFLGVNYYSNRFVRAVGADVDPAGVAGLKATELTQAGYEVTDMGWPVMPDGLRELLVSVQRTYGPRAVYITENGAAFTDVVEHGEDGSRVVHDVRRWNYLKEHFQAARRAISDGVPLRGYFVWSLMDNFEWALGYGKRFGIVHVNYDTQERTLKDSALAYRAVIQNNGLVETAENT